MDAVRGPQEFHICSPYFLLSIHAAGLGWLPRGVDRLVCGRGLGQAGKGGGVRRPLLTRTAPTHQEERPFVPCSVRANEQIAFCLVSRSGPGTNDAIYRGHEVFRLDKRSSTPLSPPWPHLQIAIADSTPNASHPCGIAGVGASGPPFPRI